MAPSSGMLHLHCDMCEDEINTTDGDGHIISLPWIIFLSPIYKFCNKKECARTVMRNYLREVEEHQFKTTLAAFVDPLCSVPELGITGYSCNKCIKMVLGGVKVLLYTGDATKIKPYYVSPDRIKKHVYGSIRVLSLE